MLMNTYVTLLFIYKYRVKTHVCKRKSEVNLYTGCILNNKNKDVRVLDSPHWIWKEKLKLWLLGSHGEDYTACLFSHPALESSVHVSLILKENPGLMK